MKSEQIMKRIENKQTSHGKHKLTRKLSAQIIHRASKLYEYFNFETKNEHLKNINVTVDGNWIKIWLSEKDYRNLNPKSKKQLKNLLKKHLYPNKCYMWGQFKYYIALGPRTVNARQQWGGQTSYRVFKFNL